MNLSKVIWIRHKRMEALLQPNEPKNTRGKHLLMLWACTLSIFGNDIWCDNNSGHPDHVDYFYFCFFVFWVSGDTFFPPIWYLYFLIEHICHITIVQHQKSQTISSPIPWYGFNTDIWDVPNIPFENDVIGPDFGSRDRIGTTQIMIVIK